MLVSIPFYTTDFSVLPFRLYMEFCGASSLIACVISDQ